jgi:Ger(x)C family germination protein
LLLLLLTGCWDRHELDERANSLMTGVDLCSEQEDCFLISSRQYAIPGRIPTGPGGRSSTDAVMVVSSPGKDGPDSRTRAQAEMARDLHFGHQRMLLWGEAFARQELRTYLDYVWRVPEIRRQMWVAVVEGRAEDVVRARPPLDPVPALYLSDQFEEAVETGRLPAQSTLGDFMVRLAGQGEEPFAPLLRLAPPYPEIVGLAVFREARMVGKLNGQELSTFLLLAGGRRTSQRLEVATSDGQVAWIELTGRAARYRIRWEQNRVHANVALSLEGDLAAGTPGVTGSDSATLRLMEQRAATEVSRLAGALLTRLQQEYRSDILGLGARVRAFHPAVWRQIPDWPAAFAAARFDFEVTVHVRRTGPVMD